MMSNKKNIRNSTGFSLLEVLITLFILAIGLLGLVALQTTSLKNNHSALHRTSAIVLAYDIIDRMRLNKNVTYAVALGNDKDTYTPGTRQNTDQDEWLEELDISLPRGRGEIVINGNIAKVTVQWDDSRGTSGGATQSFTVSTEL